VRPAVRIALFLVSLAVLVSTATPAVAHEATDADATEAVARDLLRADPAVRSGRVDAHLIEEYHEAHGHHQWNGGRGHWGHSWSTYKVQAHKLREYLRSQDVALQRFSLVMHWAKVADCESSGRWDINTGNGYYGGLQFSLGTWRAYGGHGMPNEQPAWYQAEVADRVRTRSGLHHWPVCGRYYR